MRKLLKIVLLISLLYLALSAVAGIVIAEASLRLQHRPLSHREEAATRVRQEFGAELQDVSISAADSVVLKGWYVHPQKSNGSAVVLMHGITDNREGVAGYAELFLRHGYAVLLPDARGHGESGGEFATYGIKEADDLHRGFPGCSSMMRRNASTVLVNLMARPSYCNL